MQSAQWLEGSGGMPPRKYLNFRWSEIDSVVFRIFYHGKATLIAVVG